MSCGVRRLCRPVPLSLYPLCTRVKSGGGVIIERRYVACRYGQLHVHIAQPANPARQTQNPIMCFHPSPASGWYYRNLVADPGRNGFRW